MKTTVDVLREAKAIIVDEGRWGSGELCDVQGRVCALGAIARVVYGDWDDENEVYPRLRREGAVLALSEAIDDLWGDDPLWRIYGMNDDDFSADGKTHLSLAERHTRIIDAFDRAILAESAKLARPEQEPERVSVG